MNQTINKKIYWYKPESLHLLLFLLVQKYQAPVIDASTLINVSNFTFFNIQFKHNYILLVEDNKLMRIANSTTPICVVALGQYKNSLSDILREFTQQYVETTREFLADWFETNVISNFSDIQYFNFYQVISSTAASNIKTVELWLRYSEPQNNISLLLKIKKSAKLKKFKGSKF